MTPVRDGGQLEVPRGDDQSQNHQRSWDPSTTKPSNELFVTDAIDCREPVLIRLLSLLLMTVDRCDKRGFPSRRLRDRRLCDRDVWARSCRTLTKAPVFLCQLPLALALMKLPRDSSSRQRHQRPRSRRRQNVLMIDLITIVGWCHRQNSIHRLVHSSARTIAFRGSKFSECDSMLRIWLGRHAQIK